MSRYHRVQSRDRYGNVFACISTVVKVSVAVPAKSSCSKEHVRWSVQKLRIRSRIRRVAEVESGLPSGR